MSVLKHCCLSERDGKERQTEECSRIFATQHSSILLHSQQLVLDEHIKDINIYADSNLFSIYANM